MTTLLATLFALCLLIAIHEFGHFWVARRCGVKVLRFSIGFGKPLLRWTDKKGTEYILAMLPLGGYVRMLDEREAPVDSHELHLAFNRQSVFKRMLIVAAGPVINLLTAIAILWGLTLYSHTSIIPVIGEVIEGTPAKAAGLQKGDQILMVNHETVQNWGDVTQNLASYIGETTTIQMQVQTISLETGQLEGELDSPREVEIKIDQWLKNQVDQNPIEGLGIKPYLVDVDPVVATVLSNRPADVAGLKAGDRIIRIGDVEINTWAQMQKIITDSPNQTLDIDVLRDGSQIHLQITPEKDIRATGKAIGLIGITANDAWPSFMKRDIEYSFPAAGSKAIEQTYHMSVQTLSAIYKLITNQISLSNLRGIGTVAVVAGDSAAGGLLSFLSFLALLSITLGVLNLLPIPVLDGGHLLYFVIELIIRRPVPLKVQMIGFQIGIVIILGIMLIALYNDILRFWPE